MNKYLTEYEFKKLQKLRSQLMNNKIPIYKLADYVDTLKKRYTADAIDMVTGKVRCFNQEDEEEEI